MDPRLFLRLAEMLASTCKTAQQFAPAAGRSAVSRSYYGAYNVAVEFLTAVGIRLKTGQKARGHSAVKNALIYCPDASIKKIGLSLETLHEKRKDADYDLADRTTETFPEADAACKRAGLIVDELDKCRQDAARFAQVRTDLRNWVAATPTCELQIF